MKKKQVKAMLDVIKKMKDRPVFHRVNLSKINGINSLWVTDTYAMHVIDVTGVIEDYAFNEDVKALGVSYEALERWYKLADSKSNFLDDIMEIAQENANIILPNMNRLVPSEFNALESIMINADFLSTAQTIHGEPLTLNFTGQFTAIKATTNRDGNYSILLPMRKH